MAGSSMTFTYDEARLEDGSPSPVCKVIASWTSDDTTGAVSGTTKRIAGSLIRCITDPGSVAPTDNYDIAITDEEGIDVLASSTSNLANRHTTTTQNVYLGLSDGAAMIGAFPVVCDKLTIAVTNAGNSKTGEIILYWKPA